MRWLRIMGALLLVAGLAACSTVKLAYGSLDDVAYWWLDGELDFTDDQARQVKADLARMHQWHRREELPRIAELLQRMEAAAQTPLTPDQACAFVPQLRERLQAVADEAEAPAARIARDLRPEQLAHLERRYRRRDAEFAKDWIQPAPAEVRAKRVKALADRAEMLFGTLTEGQRSAIEEAMARSAFDPARTDTERRRRQQDTLQVLRRIAAQKTDPGEAGVRLRELMERMQASPDAGYRAYQDLMIRESCVLASTLHERSTAAQRDHAARRLRGWQRDLRELAASR